MWGKIQVAVKSGALELTVNVTQTFIESCRTKKEQNIYILQDLGLEENAHKQHGLVETQLLWPLFTIVL